MTVLATVTDIERIAGSKRARRIWLDGEPFRTTSAAAVKRLELSVGDAVEPERLAAGCDAAERAAARERAIGLLARHEFSTHQLARKLRDDGYGEPAIRETLDRLAGSGLLDDERFAAALVRTRVRAGYGLRFIRRELERAGVPQAAVEAALSAAGDDLDASIDAEAVARRLARPHDDVRRLASRLARRGFDVNDAIAAARAALEDLSLSASMHQPSGEAPAPEDPLAP